MFIKHATLYFTTERNKAKAQDYAKYAWLRDKKLMKNPNQCNNGTIIQTSCIFKTICIELYTSFYNFTGLLT